MIEPRRRREREVSAAGRTGSGRPAGVRTVPMRKAPGRTVEVATRGGVARVDLDGVASRAAFLFVLTHGAGGGVGSPDLLAARDAAIGLGGLVARVLQPYRVRGASAPGSAVKQDEAWLEIVAALRKRVPKVPVVQGGRSNGARVVCRTAAAVGARGVVTLAFPLHPPGDPAKSRVDELRQPRDAGIPLLVVSGERDPFGIPDRTDADRLVVVPGETHAMRGHAVIIREAVTEWLPTVVVPLGVRGERKPLLEGNARHKSPSRTRMPGLVAGIVKET